MDQSSRTARSMRLPMLVALVVSLGVFLFRLHVFGQIEPRGDQAFFSWWVMGMEAADHALPVIGPGESVMNAMARDETGFLTQLLRPIYNSPTEGFKLLSVLLTYGVAKLFGGGYATHVATDIFASAATVFVLALFPWWWPRTRSEPAQSRRLAGAAALILGATALYPHVFSALGPHNIGIFFLLTGVVFTGRTVDALLGAPGKGRWWAYLVLFVAQGAAFYAYKTNVFLLPVATGLFVLLTPGAAWRRRIGVLLAYGVLIVPLAVPVLAAMGVDAEKAPWARDAFSFSAMMAHASGGDPWTLAARIGLRAVDWFKAGSHLFSLPGLIGALLGLAVLARRGTVLPACAVVAHFLVWCGVPLFATTGLRTYPYVIPFLVVGFADLIAWSAARWGAGGGRGRTWIPLAVAVLLAAAHLATQVPGLSSRERLAGIYPEAWRLYFAGQGELRPMIATIERTLPSNAVLMTWGYGLQYLWRVFKQPANDITVPPAISALMLRQRVGTLAEHIAHRHLHLPPAAPVFVLLDRKIDLVDANGLRDEVAAVLGPSGFGVAKAVRLVERGRWKLHSFWPRDVVLFEVNASG